VAFESRPVTDRAIAWLGEWSKVTITIRAARIIAVAEGMPLHRGGGGNGRKSGSSSTRLFSLGLPGAIRIRATSAYATLYIAIRQLSSHPCQPSTIGQPATPILRPTCMENPNRLTALGMSQDVTH
jgi:hypothetical protein